MEAETLLIGHVLGMTSGFQNMDITPNNSDFLVASQPFFSD
jgi:hypothetical protein